MARCQSRYDPMDEMAMKSRNRYDVSSYHSAVWLQRHETAVPAFRTQSEDLLVGHLRPKECAAHVYHCDQVPRLDLCIGL